MNKIPSIKYPHFATAICCQFTENGEEKTVMLTITNGRINFKYGTVITVSKRNYFENNYIIKPYLIVNPVIRVENLEEAKKIAATIPQLKNYPGENPHQTLALLSAIKNLIKPHNYTKVNAVDPVFKITSLAGNEKLINWLFDEDMYTIATFRVKKSTSGDIVVSEFGQIKPEINYTNLKKCLQQFPNTMLAKLWGISGNTTRNATTPIKLIKHEELFMQEVNNLLKQSQPQNPAATPEDYSCLKYETLNAKGKLNKKEQKEFDELKKIYGNLNQEK